MCRSVPTLAPAMPVVTPAPTPAPITPAPTPDPTPAPTPAPTLAPTIADEPVSGSGGSERDPPARDPIHAKYTASRDNPDFWIPNDFQDFVTPTPGFRLLFNTNLVDVELDMNSSPIGKVFGFCTLINTATLYFCNLEWNFGFDGAIVSAGTMDVDAISTNLVITGGTGSFEGVQGVINQEFIHPGFTDRRVTFEFQ